VKSKDDINQNHRAKCGNSKFNVRPGIIESESVLDEAADQLPVTMRVGITTNPDHNQLFVLLIRRKIKTINIGTANTSRFTQIRTKDIFIWWSMSNSRMNTSGTPNIVV
jgi:hypothetical protein